MRCLVSETGEFQSYAMLFGHMKKKNLRFNLRTALSSIFSLDIPFDKLILNYLISS